jgi:DNA-binding GntR family transcriptional regulator
MGEKPDPAHLRANDELHGLLMTISDNRAFATVLEQLTPTLRRTQRTRFGPLQGQSSVAQHDELTRLRAVGDLEGLAAVTCNSWHSPPATVEPIVERDGAPATPPNAED